ncbi:MAG: hypothetical protein JSV88_04045 [Candidatus Aminicenantes bacterium]|nr:MAG: hypothetical protein JSV88_04045 [Candidatus Aminicenantes bacterium]
MNYRRLLVFIIAVLLVFSLNTFGKTKKITGVGRYALIGKPGEIKDVDKLKELLEKHADRIKEAFEKAEAGYLYDGFMAKVSSGEIEEKQLPKGQEIPWMAFKVGKKIKVVKDLVWAANKPLDVFALTVEHDCKDYVMIIPKGCGNLTVMDIKNTYATCDIKVTPEKVNIGDEITVDLSGSKCAVKYEVTVLYEGSQVDFKELTDPVWKTKYDKTGNYTITAKAFNTDGVASTNDCEAKFSITYLPECDLKVDPVDGYVGQPFTLDASGSTDQDGQVVKAEFIIKDKNGNEVDTNTITTTPLVWEKKFNKSGRFKVWLQVTDDFGAVSAKACELEVKVQKRFYVLFELGPMLAKGTYTGYVFGRLGFSYLIVPERLSVIASGGGALKLAGDAFKNHFLSNLLLNLHLSDVFLGAGVGYSTEVRDDWEGGMDFVGNIGFDIFKGFNKKGSIFGEVRIPFGREDLDTSDAHSFLLGFRYQF